MVAPIIGEKRTVGKFACQWIICPVCGRTRWVRLEKGVPRSKVCRQCCSDETKERMRESALGHYVSPETRSKISRARVGHIGYMLGKHHTEETKKKLSELRTGKSMSVATREKLRLANFGKRLSAETKEKIRRAGLGRKHCLGKKPSVFSIEKSQQRMIAYMSQPEYRKRVLDALHSPVSREKARLSSLGKVVSTETREKISKSLKGHKFFNKEKWLITRQKGLHVKPNQKEKHLLWLLDELCPREWKYVGDWSFVIAGKNPDFVDINGKKLIIELFGDYWHKGEDPEERIALFREFGYKTLIIWERELKKLPELSARIQEFVT